MAKKVALFGIFGLVGAIVGGVTIGVFPLIFDAVLESKMVLTPDSYSYEMWKDLPIPMYTSLYLFNVSNANEILTNRTVKPILVELGPYVFEESHFKDGEVWNNENGTLTYLAGKTWVFMAERSNGSLDDLVTTINPIALAAADYARVRKDPFTMLMLSDMFKEIDAKLFITYPVRNFTFDGIVEEIMEATPQLPFKPPIPFDKFGWFYARNGSADYDGTFSMFTGEVDFDQVGQISEWNHQGAVPEHVYSGDCGVLKGSAGEFFPPNRDRTWLDYFSPDICRSIRFEYEQDARVKDILGYRFALGSNMVNNSMKENSCFNPFPDEELGELKNGLLNVSACKFDSPAYVSYPHFYLADQSLLDQFDPTSTLNPSVEKHQSYITLEPTASLPLEVTMRLQINVLSRSMSLVANEFGDIVTVELLDGLPTTYYPMIWFETVAALDEDLVGMVKLMVAAPSIGLGVGVGMTVSGFFLIALAVFFWKKRRSHCGGT